MTDKTNTLSKAIALCCLLMLAACENKENYEIREKYHNFNNAEASIISMMQDRTIKSFQTYGKNLPEQILAGKCMFIHASVNDDFVICKEVPQ